MQYLFTNVELILFTILSISSVILFSVSFKFDERFDSTISVLITMIYISFLITRTGSGVDEWVYLHEYINYINTGVTPFGFSMEFVFYIFNSIGVTANTFKLIFTILYPILSIFIVFIVVKGRCKSVVIFLFLFSDFTLDLNFNLYRQALSTLFFILSAYCFFNRRLFLFLFFSLTSIGFHWSSFIMIFSLFVTLFISAANCKRILLTGLILQILVFFVKIDTLGYIYDIGELIFSGSSFLTKLRSYILYSDNTFYTQSFKYKFMFMFPIWCSYFLCLYLYFKGSCDSKKWLSIISILGIYSVLLIDMNFSFRNYYWFCALVPLLVQYVSIKDRIAHVLIRMYGVFWAFAGFYSGPLMKLVFPG